MGFECASLTVYATLDRHNDERTQRDDKLWEELKARIVALLNEPKYEAIRPST